MVEETAERPILIGRPDVIEQRIERAGLTIKLGEQVDLVNPQNDPRYRDYWETYHSLMARRGVTPDLARAIMRTNTTAIGAVMVHRDEADSLICGTFGEFRWHMNYAAQILGRGDLHPVGALSMMILEDGPLFIADTHVHTEPTPQQLAEIVIGAARHVRRFGLDPQIALCSHSQFGNQPTGTGAQARAALEILDAGGHDFTYDGEMNIDTALDPELRARIMPGKAEVPRSEYMRAFAAAVDVFGRAQVSTYLLAGLGDSRESLLDAARQLIEIGVYPFVVPFDPVRGTQLETHQAPRVEFMREVLPPIGEMLSIAGMTSATVKAGCAKCGACSSLSSFEDPTSTCLSS